MNPKMVERDTSPRAEPRLGTTPHFAPLTPQNAEREKRSQRLGEISRRTVHGFNARMVGGNLTPALSTGFVFIPTTLIRPAGTFSHSRGRRTTEEARIGLTGISAIENNSRAFG